MSSLYRKAVGGPNAHGFFRSWGEGPGGCGPHGRVKRMNIVLIGYRCAGKSSVGQVLARVLGRRFVDTDAAVEASAGAPIEALVAREGWPRFREMERRIIREVCRTRKEVIATGGGTVSDPSNLRHLRKSGWIVWLQADPGELMERMRRDSCKRPSLTGTDSIEEIRKVLEERSPAYRRACDLRVDTCGRSVKEVAEGIIKNMPKNIRC